MSFAKIFAVTAAAACCGGGVILGAGGASGSPPTPPVALDHYLCSNHFDDASCDPVQTVLPDGTTFSVNDPNGRLVCRDTRRRRHHDTVAPTTVSVGDEFSTPPVALSVGDVRSSCTIVHHHFAGAMHTHGASDAEFMCSPVSYPDGSTARFTPPSPVTLHDHVTLNVTVLDPNRLCVSTDPTTATATNGDLLCFRVEVVEASRHRHHFTRFAELCVPSTDPTGMPPTSDSTTTTAATTTSAPTTTTKPVVTTTTAAPTTTTVAPTTTTAPPTTTTTAPPTTTTTPTSTSQPCAGIIVNGKCIINS